LFYAYPARRINAPPQFNGAPHLTLGAADAYSRLALSAHYIHEEAT